MASSNSAGRAAATTATVRQQQQQQTLTIREIEARTWRLLPLPTGVLSVSQHRSSGEHVQSVVRTAVEDFWQRLLQQQQPQQHPCLPVEVLHLQRVPGADCKGQARLRQLLAEPALIASCDLLARRAVLYWGWSVRRSSVRLYGVLYPRQVLAQWREAPLKAPNVQLGSVLIQTVRLSAGLVKLLSLNEPLPPFAFHGTERYDRSVPLPLPEELHPAPSEWYCHANNVIDTREGCFALAEAPVVGSSTIKGLEYRPDQSEFYLGDFKRLFFAQAVFNDTLESGGVLPSGSSQKALFERLALNYLFALDLTDDAERKQELLVRVLTGLFAMRLLLHDAKMKRENHLAVGMDALAGSRGLGLLRTLAMQGWLRQQFLYQNDEQAVLQALARAGESFLALPALVPRNMSWLDILRWQEGKPTLAAVPLPPPPPPPTADKQQPHCHIPLSAAGFAKLIKAKLLYKQVPLPEHCKRPPPKDPEQLFTANEARCVMNLGDVKYYEKAAEASAHVSICAAQGLSCSVLRSSATSNFLTATERTARTHAPAAGKLTLVGDTNAFWGLPELIQAAATGGVSTSHQVLLDALPVILYYVCPVALDTDGTDLLQFMFETIKKQLHEVVQLQLNLSPCYVGKHPHQRVLFCQHMPLELEFSEHAMVVSFTHHAAVDADNAKHWLVALPSVIFPDRNALYNFLEPVYDIIQSHQAQPEREAVGAIKYMLGRFYGAGQAYPLVQPNQRALFELHPSIRYFTERVFQAKRAPKRKAAAALPPTAEAPPAPEAVPAKPKQQQLSAVATAGCESLSRVPFPSITQQRDQFVARELHRFLQSYATTPTLLPPVWFLMVPAAELDHTLPTAAAATATHTTNNTSRCIYECLAPLCYGEAGSSQYSSKCTICSDPQPMLYEDAKTKQLWRCITYPQVPMWHIGKLLHQLRLIYDQVATENVNNGRRRNPLAVEPLDLDGYMSRVGLGHLWKELQDCYSQESRGRHKAGGGGMREGGAMITNMDLVERDLKEFGSYVYEQQQLLEERQRKQAELVGDDEEPVVLRARKSLKKSKSSSSSSCSGGPEDTRSNSGVSTISSSGSGSGGGGIQVHNQRGEPIQLSKTFQYSSHSIDLIKKWIAHDPLRFYVPFKGSDYRITGHEARWGTSGGFAVNVDGKSADPMRGLLGSEVALSIAGSAEEVRERILAGHFRDFVGGYRGDAIKFIMLERYHSTECDKSFIAALLFCHAWVLRTYGNDALERVPGAIVVKPQQQQQAKRKAEATPPAAAAATTTTKLLLPNITAQLATTAIDKPLTQSGPVPLEEQKRVRDARDLWSKCRKIQRGGGNNNLVVDYLRKSRGIELQHLFYEQDCLRFHPNFPVYEEKRQYEYPCMVSKFVNPLNYPHKSTEELFGIQDTALSEQDNSKSKALRTVKKIHGASGGNFVPLHIVRPRNAQLDDELPQHVRIAIAEGVETGASVAEACPELDVWVSGGINNMSQFPLGAGGLEEDKDLIFCADWDGAEGELRIMKEINKLCLRGWRVHLALPPSLEKEFPKAKLQAGTDFNNYLTLIKPRGRALERIRKIVLEGRRVFEPLTEGSSETHGVFFDNTKEVGCFEQEAGNSNNSLSGSVHVQ